MEDNQIARVLAVYSEALELFADRLNDAGTRVPPEPKIWRRLPCGHYVSLDHDASTKCSACLSSALDRHHVRLGH